jgi:hypothetical protein
MEITSILRSCEGNIRSVGLGDLAVIGPNCRTTTRSMAQGQNIYNFATHKSYQIAIIYILGMYPCVATEDKLTNLQRLKP